MKILYSVILIVIFLSYRTVGDQCLNEVVSSSDENILRNIKEIEWPKAYLEQDSALLDNILADDFEFIDANGIVTDKTYEIDWIKRNKINIDSMHYKIERLTIYKNGTAIISGTGFQYNDSTITKYKSTNVFIKCECQWKAVASHNSGINRQKRIN